MKLNKALALAGWLLLLLSLVTLATLQITVKTPYPIYINGTLYLPGTYTFNSPVVIWLPQYYNGVSYLVHCYYLVTSSPTNQYYPTTYPLLINYNATVEPAYCQVYWLLQYVGFPVTAYVTYTTPFNQTAVERVALQTGYYPQGVITIPEQVYIINSTTEVYVPRQVINLTGVTPYTLEYTYYYYVSVNQPVPAVINGKPGILTSGFYPVGTTVTINSSEVVGPTAILEITAVPQVFTVSGPMTVKASTKLVYTTPTATTTTTTVTSTTTVTATPTPITITTTITTPAVKPPAWMIALLITLAVLLAVVIALYVAEKSS
jgi:hypothetical protein